jgi:hypothetical protein
VILVTLVPSISPGLRIVFRKCVARHQFPVHSPVLVEASVRMIREITSANLNKRPVSL